MIIEYHRPESLLAALTLLKRSSPKTVPLAGGSSLNQPAEDGLAVVDVQALGLQSITSRGSQLEIGAATTLQALLDFDGLPASLANAIRLETAHNLRQVASLAGTLVSADGRSPLATVLLALDSELTLLDLSEDGSQSLVETTLRLGDYLPLRAVSRPGKLITKVTLPLNARVAYEYIARTPADRPVVCAAAARWPSGRTRLTLGGFGATPMLAMDGPEMAGAETAARDAYSQAGDAWASAEYRQEMAGVLARRVCAE